MANALRVRLGAIRCALQNIEGMARHEATSRIHADAVLTLLSRTHVMMDPVEKADLVGMVNAVPWADGHEIGILNLLQDGGKKNHPKRLQQDYLAFPEHMTAKIWRSVLDKDVPATAVLTTFVVRLCRLGLRCPKEHTFKLLASLWMHLTLEEPLNILLTQK